MCLSKNLITIEEIIARFALTADVHQGASAEYTLYSAPARFDTPSPQNTGQTQAWFYRAMGAAEFEGFLFGKIQPMNGHQGFGSFRQYSKPYLKDLMKKNHYAVLLEVHAPNWLREMASHGWHVGKAESGDISWGIGLTQSNGWNASGGHRYRNKNEARTPLSIFESTARTYKVVDLLVGTKFKKGSSLSAPADAPWFGILKAIDTQVASAEAIALLKASMGSAPARVPVSEARDENGIPFDGNCLFHALARGLQRRGVAKLTHQELRDYVCLFMTNNPAFCQAWGIDEAYIANMGLAGT